MNRFRQIFARKPVAASGADEQNSLRRCITLIDLTGLGIGATLGSGAYVVAGTIARNKAGPGVILSFLMAALASLFSGLCYAEFGSRVPKAGSAYVYTYVTMGEIYGFFIGWNMVLEYVIGTAAAARAATTYIDVFANDQIKLFYQNHLAMGIPGFAPYFDPIAIAIVIVITVILVVGVKESAIFNNTFTAINMCVLIFVSCIGFYYADFNNWSIPQDDVPCRDYSTSNGTCQSFHPVTVDQCIDDPSTHRACFGTGGFLPYGFRGVVEGGSAAFFSFVGFDCISACGEEVINPSRNMPLGIAGTLTICAIFYMSLSAVITLVVPYYKLDDYSPVALAFETIGVKWMKYVISAGAICGITTSCLGGLYPMPRILYSMADDGLLFSPLASISDRFQTPIIATIFTGVITVAFTALFDLDALVNMLSIGTLFAYTFVCLSVILLRYEPKRDEDQQSTGDNTSVDSKSLSHSIKAIFTGNGQSANIVTNFIFNQALLLIGLIIICLIAITSILVYHHTNSTYFYLIPIGVAALVLLVAYIRLLSLPSNRPIFDGFKAPLVPHIPLLGCAVNIYLIVALDGATWIRFVIWFLIGLVIYGSYGFWHSKLRKNNSVDPVNENSHLLASSSDDDMLANQAGSESSLIR